MIVQVLDVAKVYKTISNYIGSLGTLMFQFERDQEYIFEQINEKLIEIKDLLEKLPKKTKEQRFIDRFKIGVFIAERTFVRMQMEAHQEFTREYIIPIPEYETISELHKKRIIPLKDLQQFVKEKTDINLITCEGCELLGICCYLDIKGKVINIPCKYLDKAGKCKVYQNRFDKNKLCLDIEKSIKLGTLPKFCNYVKYDREYQERKDTRHFNKKLINRIKKKRKRNQ